MCFSNMKHILCFNKITLNKMLNVDYKMFYSKYVKMGKNEPSSTAILFMFEGENCQINTILHIAILWRSFDMINRSS